MARLEIERIPVLQDNYVWLAREPDSGSVAAVDPSVAGPVLAAAERRGWRITHILNTHHHPDHTGGNLEIKRATGAVIVGPSHDRDRIPGIDVEVSDGGTYDLGTERADIFFVPGHTRGHIAFWFKTSDALFCGDTLFLMGCGRLFEGTPAQMWHSLQKLMALPPQTLICSGHEYTASNARFAASLDLHNPALTSRITDITAARAANRPTVPSTLAIELATNPFLRAPQLKPVLGLHDTSDAETFAHIRALKDNFR